MLSGKYLVRHIPSAQQALEQEELGNAMWPPGPANPAGGLTQVKSDFVPLSSLLKAGSFFRGNCAPFREWRIRNLLALEGGSLSRRLAPSLPLGMPVIGG